MLAGVGRRANSCLSVAKCLCSSVAKCRFLSLAHFRVGSRFCPYKTEWLKTWMTVVPSDKECSKRPIKSNCWKLFSATLSFRILAILLILVILCEYTVASTVAGPNQLIVGGVRWKWDFFLVRRKKKTESGRVIIRWNELYWIYPNNRTGFSTEIPISNLYLVEDCGSQGK